MSKIQKDLKKILDHLNRKLEANPLANDMAKSVWAEQAIEEIKLLLPQTININGVEVPKGLSSGPPAGYSEERKVYASNPTRPKGFTTHDYRDYYLEEFFYGANLVHRTPQDALAMTRAMASHVEYEDIEE